jgi:hypothetical protein
MNPMQKSYFIIASTEYGTLNPILTQSERPFRQSSIRDGVLELPLPNDFLNSKNQKWIEVRNVKILIENATVSDVKFHSTIVYENPWDHNFICFGNEQVIKPKKFEWKATKPTIKLWFTDMKNEKLYPDDYTVETLLIF